MVKARKVKEKVSKQTFKHTLSGTMRKRYNLSYFYLYTFRVKNTGYHNYLSFLVNASTNIKYNNELLYSYLEIFFVIK